MACFDAVAASFVNRIRLSTRYTHVSCSSFTWLAIFNGQNTVSFSFEADSYERGEVLFHHIVCFPATV